MNLLADENVDGPIVRRLRMLGYQVAYVAEMEPGIPDDEVLTKARALGAVLLTSDKDFGELVYRRGQASGGVVLLRLAGLPPGERAELVAKTLDTYSSELEGAFSVLTSRSLRVRSG